MWCASCVRGDLHRLRKPPSGRGHGRIGPHQRAEGWQSGRHHAGGRVTTRRLGFLMTGQEFDYQVRDLWQGQGSTPVLEVRNLSRKGNIITSP